MSQESKSPDKPAEGIFAACQAAGRSGWALAGWALLFGLVGTAITIWLPDLVGQLFGGSRPDYGKAATDGRLATLALGNVFTLSCAHYVISDPKRRQQYPFVFLSLVVTTILCTLAIAAHLARANLPNVDFGLVAWISWAGALFTLIAGFVLQVARAGEEKILEGWQPRRTSEEQADDYANRVGKEI